MSKSCDTTRVPAEQAFLAMQFDKTGFWWLSLAAWGAGLIDNALAAAWERAAAATPHGQPIRLENDPLHQPH